MVDKKPAFVAIMEKKRQICAALLGSTSLLIAACSHTQPGVEIRTVEVPVIEQAPCPGVVPVSPGPLGPLADDYRAALAQTLAKLVEWSGEGMYGDQAESYFEVCPPSD